MRWLGCLSAASLVRYSGHEELDEVAREKEVWASLLKLLPQPVPGQAEENEWLDGWMNLNEMTYFLTINGCNKVLRSRTDSIRLS